MRGVRGYGWRRSKRRSVGEGEVVRVLSLKGRREGWRGEGDE